MDEGEFLRQLMLFQDLSPQRVETLRGIARRQTVEAGEAIVREGDRGDTMYVLLEGRVEVSRTLTMRLDEHRIGEAEKSFTRLDAKDHVLFGEMSLLERSERAATVVAVTPCVLLAIAHADFEQVCAADPGLAAIVFRNMARQLSARLRRTNQDVLKLTTALSLALNTH